jgi:hypothetical protein
MKIILFSVLISFCAQIIIAQEKTLTVELPATRKGEAIVVGITINENGIISKISNLKKSNQTSLEEFAIEIDGNVIKIHKVYPGNDSLYLLKMGKSQIEYTDSFKQKDGAYHIYRKSVIRIFETGPIIFIDKFEDKLNNGNYKIQLTKDKEGVVEEKSDIFSRKYFNGNLIETLNNIPQEKMSFKEINNIVYVDQFEWMDGWDSLSLSSRPVKISGINAIGKNRFLNTINYYILNSCSYVSPELFFPFLFAK